MTDPTPDIESFEERAAILEYDAGFTRKDAEARAAKAQGYLSVEHYKRAIRQYLTDLAPTE